MLRTLATRLLLLCLGATAGWAGATLGAVDPFDPVTAAPVFHRVLLENEHVRVLNVVIPPGATVPAHRYGRPAVSLTLAPAELSYRDGDGNPVRHVRAPDLGTPLPVVGWSAPGADPASVRNIDTAGYRELRIELKGLSTDARPDEPNTAP